MVKKNALLFYMVILVNLSGCAKSVLDNQDVRCPFVERGGCQSMEQVNQMIRKRKFTPDGHYVQQACCVSSIAFSK